MNLDKIMISYNNELYLLIPIIESQHWNSGILKNDAASYTGIWWEMNATDSDGNEYILCWFEESVDEDDDGIVDVNLYKPDIIQCTFCIDE